MANKAELIAEQLASAMKVSDIWGDIIYNIKVFGAKGDGLSDDTDAIQRAIDAAGEGGLVYFPKPEVYYKITSTLVVSKNNVKLGSISQPYYSTRIKGAMASMTMIKVTGYGFMMENLWLEGDAVWSSGEGATINGILFERGDGSSDVDAEVRHSWFFKLNSCITVKGKNGNIHGNEFTTSIIGVDLQQIPGQECRGHNICGNRFHTMGADSSDPSVANSVCVQANGDLNLTYRNKIDSNYADGVKKFFVGRATESSISLNELPFSRGQAIEVTYSGGGCRIIGNNIQDRYNGSGSSTGGGIKYTGSAGVISKNIITGKREHGIQLVAGTRNEIEGNILIDNDWGKIGTFDAIYIDTDSIYNTIAYNTIDIVANTQGVRYGIHLIGNENTLGPNIIRSTKTAPINDTRSANMGDLTGLYSGRRRLVYADTLANGAAIITIPQPGDIVKLNNGSTGFPCEYIYASGGWKLSKQAGINKNNTANRPTGLTAADSGLQYLDTTLAAGGKLIIYSGTGWVDTTGTAV